MVVLDENIHDRRNIEAISDWYPGQVVSIISLRPGTVIKDDAVPSLLRSVEQPTFITINAVDFWKRIPPHQEYCAILIDLPKERIRDIPGLLREILNIPLFRTKASRMGKGLRLHQNHIEYDESDRKIQSIFWQE